MMICKGGRDRAREKREETGRWKAGGRWGGIEQKTQFHFTVLLYSELKQSVLLQGSHLAFVFCSTLNLCHPQPLLLASPQLPTSTTTVVLFRHAGFPGS